ncbi:DUF3072 domain-containing protein [Nakamurella deserti]|uniref:DUF3072 domain-containing protein n=1 Tax=Nakamurella deserti TaxID=2164074 RepID=UPI000DBE9297|nr:DUF3072 domain-containing protein [Nakamurella deserti]
MSKPSDTAAGDSNATASDENVSTNPEKDPKEWVTGGEPMTGPQESYLHTLAQEADVEVPEDLTKADASTMIDELQGKTGRGQ